MTAGHNFWRPGRGHRSARSPQALSPAGATGRMLKYANPLQFRRVRANRISPICARSRCILLAALDYLPSVRARRLPAGRRVTHHVHPRAGLAGSACSPAVMSSAALGTLVWRHPVADAAQKAAAPLGAGVHFRLPRHVGRSGASRCGAPIGSGMRVTSMLVLLLISSR